MMTAMEVDNGTSLMTEGNSFRLFQVDSFADEPFAGNPAAVCYVSGKATSEGAGQMEMEMEDLCKWTGMILSAEKMRAIAAEMNLSETAFVFPLTSRSEDSGALGNEFGLRWFTPTKEVNLCGHATLATAAVLFCGMGNRAEQLRFRTLSGILTATLVGMVQGRPEIQLVLPMNPPEHCPRSQFKKLISAAVGNFNVQDVQYSKTTKKLLIRLQDGVRRDELEEMYVDPAELQQLEQSGQVTGVIVTVRGEENGKYCFYSRYFAPWNGIPEDPVTGSAHTVLAPYWGQALKNSNMQARQCSKRGGDLSISLKEEDRKILVAGSATIVLEGRVRHE
eukprot:Nk52_evm28s2340 gene=Nk52_evmTU28s2340